MSALVVVLLGTDHHRFDRLVEWADTAAGRLAADAHVVIQHGASRSPRTAEGHGFLRHSEIQHLLGAARAVVCHGGPGTIMDAQTHGHVPLCVPRDPALGEHVDDHQLRFATTVARAGVVRLAGDEAGFHSVLDGLLSTGPVHGRQEVVEASPLLLSRVRLAQELDQLDGARPLRRSSLRRTWKSRVTR
ncbi:glycosyltransferase [Nocardioides pacificus]